MKKNKIKLIISLIPAFLSTIFIYPFLMLGYLIVNPKLYRFYRLDSLINKCLRKNNYKKAENLANEYLNLAKEFRDDWNYGNAIHTGHQALGLVYLEKGELEMAKGELIFAANTPGSPQLNSFGPGMVLARKLLEKNEKDIVIQYLNLVEQFWCAKNGNDEIFIEAAKLNKNSIDRWKKEIENGKIPKDSLWRINQKITI